MEKDNHNLLLDMMEYKSRSDSSVKARYAAIIIADNRYSQCNYEGQMHMVLHEILDLCKFDLAI